MGGIWYSQGVFGKTWGRLANLKMDGKMTSANMAPLLLIQLASSFITAYVLAHFVFVMHYFFKDAWVTDAFVTAVWAWLGFTAARLATHDLFEGRRKKLTLLNLSHELVNLVVMGLIIGWLHP
ncbi:MAG: DUF1761 domain-containing protein [Candidatus Saccharibacteria bacterium]